MNLNEGLGRVVLSSMLGMLGAGCGSWVVKKVATDEVEETAPETERFVDAPVCRRTPIRNLSGQWVGATEDGAVWSFQAVQRGAELDVCTFFLEQPRGKLGGHVVWASGDSAYVALRRTDCPSVPDPLEQPSQGEPRMDDPFEVPQDEEDEQDEPRAAATAP